MPRLLISPETAAPLIASGSARVIDCRSQLGNPSYGEKAFAEGHLPGAVHASLDNDLSDLTIAGHGRHPLPRVSTFSAVISRWGLHSEDSVIAYDDADGAYAARLWFLLRLAGHRKVMLLDGGFAAWRLAGLPIEREVFVPNSSRYPVSFADGVVVDADAVLTHVVAAHDRVLIDARGAPRYRGEVEPIDPVAGHVPGAVNRPYTQNLGPDGRFKPAEQLRREFLPLVGNRAIDSVWHMCGSGVTACHNLFAMELAGLRGSHLFADSWSGWISDSKRPVARGEST